MIEYAKWAEVKRQNTSPEIVWARLGKALTAAAQAEDAANGSELPRAIVNAKGAQMPEAQRMQLLQEAQNAPRPTYQELTYEGYAAGEVAIFVPCLTASVNRTVANIRALFRRYDGQLATSGAVAFRFARKGFFVLARTESMDLAALELAWIDGGAEEIELSDTQISIFTDIEEMPLMEATLADLALTPIVAKAIYAPTTYADVDASTAATALQLIQALEADEDVQEVYHNLVLTPALEAQWTKKA